MNVAQDLFETTPQRRCRIYMRVQKLLVSHAKTYDRDTKINRFLNWTWKENKDNLESRNKENNIPNFYTGKDGVGCTRPINGGPPPNPWVSGRAYTFFNHNCKIILCTISSHSQNLDCIYHLNIAMPDDDVFNSSISQPHTQQHFIVTQESTNQYSQSDIKNNMKSQYAN